MHYSEKLHQQVPTVEIKVPASTLLVLNDDAQVLLLKPHDEDKWVLPWGEMRAKESALECALRVTQNETSLDILDVECVGFSSAFEANHVKNAENHPQHLHLFIFVSTYFSGTLELKDQFSEVGFFGINELPEIAGPFSHAIEQFKKWLPTRQMQMD